MRNLAIIAGVVHIATGIVWLLRISRENWQPVALICAGAIIIGITWGTMR